MSGEKRPKAQDVFNQSNFVFSEKVSFKEAFPQVKSVRIKVDEGELGSQGTIPRYYSEGNIGEFVNCSNPLCYDGGFSIGSILRSMVEKKEKHRETTEVCRGYEGSPKGRKKYSRCFHLFKVFVDVEYLDETSGSL
jgi:hypothetical protein